MLNCKVGLFNLIKEEAGEFQKILIHEKCGDKVERKVDYHCASCGIVPGEETKKVYKYGDRLIPVPENLKLVEDKNVIEIRKIFLKRYLNEIYLRNFYLLIPEKGEEFQWRAFFDALRKTNTAALGGLFILKKYYNCCIFPSRYDYFLILATLYDYHQLDIPEVKLPSFGLDKKYKEVVQNLVSEINKSFIPLLESSKELVNPQKMREIEFIRNYIKKQKK